MGSTSEREFGDLSGLNEGQLAEMFQRRGNDLTFLDALNEELKQRNSEAANDLHIRVIMARRALLRAQPAAEPQRAAPPPEPFHDWLHAFLRARNLARPDGRPLYRYRMEDGEYEQVKKMLRRLAGAGHLVEPDSRAGALFVAYCAEWFRRESASTFLRWDGPAPDLFPSVPYASKQALSNAGLDYWRRPLRRSAYAREFLLTVALEGGFPVRILTEGARGWLREYLRAIMRRAIAWRVHRPDEILAIAEEERGRMRKSYQHDDFVALCSELVTSLLELRRAWRSAISRQCTALTSALEAALGKEKAMNEAVAWLRGVCGDLNALEPALATIFFTAGLAIGQTIDFPSLRDLTSSYIRDQRQRGGDALNDLAACLASIGLKLPPEIETKSHTDFAGLFAPVLLAASAREKLVLDRKLALIARRALREDPMYVSGSWSHLVKFYS